MLAGLAAAHKSGIMHRDLKPENVLLADDGRIKIGDFGLARAASANTARGAALLGTIAYLSPELVTRGIADTRSDIYALGIMLYEMLTGEQPYKGEQPMQIAYQHANDTVPVPSPMNPRVPPSSTSSCCGRPPATPISALATPGPCSSSSSSCSADPAGAAPREPSRRSSAPRSPRRIRDPGARHRDGPRRAAPSRPTPKPLRAATAAATVAASFAAVLVVVAPRRGHRLVLRQAGPARPPRSRAELDATTPRSAGFTRAGSAPPRQQRRCTRPKDSSTATRPKAPTSPPR